MTDSLRSQECCPTLSSRASKRLAPISTMDRSRSRELTEGGIQYPSSPIMLWMPSFPNTLKDARRGRSGTTDPALVRLSCSVSRWGMWLMYTRNRTASPAPTPSMSTEERFNPNDRQENRIGASTDGVLQPKLPTMEDRASMPRFPMRLHPSPRYRRRTWRIWYSSWASGRPAHGLTASIRSIHGPASLFRALHSSSRWNSRRSGVRARPRWSTSASNPSALTSLLLPGRRPCAALHGHVQMEPPQTVRVDGPELVGHERLVPDAVLRHVQLQLLEVGHVAERGVPQAHETVVQQGVGMEPQRQRTEVRVPRREPSGEVVAPRPRPSEAG